SSNGISVTFTANLSTVSPGSGVPIGAVQFVTNGLAAGGPVPLISGSASFSTALLPLGANSVAAEYAGDGNCLGSTNSLSQVVFGSSPIVPGSTLGPLTVPDAGIAEFTDTNP